MVSLTGVLVSNCIAFSFFLLGKWGSPISDVPNPAKKGDNYGNNAAIEGAKSETAVALSGLEHLISRFPTPFIFPLFYLTFFLGIPAAVGVVVSLLLEEDSPEDLLFIQSLDHNSLNALIWVSVYFFCLSALPSTFSCLQSLATEKSWEKIWNIVPLSYCERIQWNAAFCAHALLFVAVCMITAENDIKDSDEANDLKLAAVLLPVATGIFFFYEGYIYFMDFFYFATIPGFKSSWWFAHIGGMGYIFYLLGTTNEIAAGLLAAAWGLFWLIPNLVWIGFSKKSDALAESERVRHIHKVETEASNGAVLGTAHITLESAPMSLGCKHYVYCFSLWRQHPSPAIVAKAPVETALSGKLAMNLIVQDPAVILERWNLGDSIGAFLVPILLPFIFFSIFIHSLHMKKGQLFSSITKPGKNYRIYYTPGLLRTTPVLSIGTPCPIFFVDGPGVDVALGYLQGFFHRLESGNEGHCKPTFIFRCDSHYQVLKIASLLNEFLSKKIETEEKKDPFAEGTFTVQIIYTGPLKSRVNNILGCSEEFKKENDVLGRLQNMISVAPHAKGFSSFDFHPIIQDEEDSDVAVTTIGTAKIAYQVRRLLSKTGKSKVKFTDIVVEDSVFNQPMQSNPMEEYI